jgi:putative flippase GtrA
MKLAALVDFFRNNFLSMCRYVLVGSFIYGVEYCGYVLLIVCCSAVPLYANAAAKIIAGLIAYIFHRVYTFKKSFSEGLYNDFVKYYWLIYRYLV